MLKGIISFGAGALSAVVVNKFYKKGRQIKAAEFIIKETDIMNSDNTKIKNAITEAMEAFESEIEELDESVECEEIEDDGAFDDDESWKEIESDYDPKHDYDFDKYPDRENMWDYFINETKLGNKINFIGIGAKAYASDASRSISDFFRHIATKIK